MSYHLAEIERGVFGEPSKIREEFEEFMDARVQGCRIMELVELSDMIGAIEGYLENEHPDTTLYDLVLMSRITQRAFKSGARSPRRD